MVTVSGAHSAIQLLRYLLQAKHSNSPGSTDYINQITGDYEMSLNNCLHVSNVNLDSR